MSLIRPKRTMGQIRAAARLVCCGVLTLAPLSCAPRSIDLATHAPDPLAHTRAELARELRAALTAAGAAPAAAKASPDASLPAAFHFEAAPPDARGGRRFVARGRGHRLLLAPEEVLLAQIAPEGTRGDGARRALRMLFPGAASAPELVGEKPLRGRAHYFVGNDAEAWRTDVPLFGQVRYAALYPGVDMRVHGDRGELEYDFLLAAGADPAQIQLGFEGADAVEIDADGALVLRVGNRALRMRAPVAYQSADRARRAVAVRYALLDTAAQPRVGFQLGAYDDAQPLVIDPIISFATFLGGSGHDFAQDVVVDPKGFVYVVGQTGSADFPQVGTQHAEAGPAYTAFVTKIDPTGSEVIYSTYLGGTGNLDGYEQMAIAVDPEGSVYLTGETDAPDFPTVNAVMPTPRGARDAFVVKLGPGGKKITYATYLGGSSIDLGRGIAVDSIGFAYVFGITYSTDFPVVSAWQSSLRGASDAFLTRLSPDGSLVIFSTYLGGSGREFGYDLVGDGNAAGFLYATGFTDSTDFPTTAGAFLEVDPPGADGFVMKLNGQSGAPVYASYLGGSADEEGLGIALDRQGRAHVAGWTLSTDFPVAGALQPDSAGDFDAYVVRMSADGSAVEFGTYLGGGGKEAAYSLAVGRDASIHVAGITESSDFPTLAPLQDTRSGTGDAFVAHLDPASGSLLHSTYLGGSAIESILGYSLGLALDAADNVYVALMTASPDFPVRAALQPVKGAGLDAAVVKFSSAPEVVVRTREVGGGVQFDFFLANGSSESQPVELKLWISADGGWSNQSLLDIPLTLPPRLRPISHRIDLPASFTPYVTRIGARLLEADTGRIVSESLCASTPCR